VTGALSGKTTPRLQLVVPCYNEADRLRPEAFLSLVAAAPDIGLLFVDDGSTDQTPTILADLARHGGGRIAVLTLPRNAGKSGAVQRGVQAALEHAPQFVGFWDADLSTPLTAIDELMEVVDACPGVDIVMGSRVKLLGRHIRRNELRHYCGRLFATAASLAVRLGAYDTQCGAKIFRVNEAVRRAFTAPFRSRWVFDLEILKRYLAAGGSASHIYEVPLTTWTDVPGSKLGVGHAFRALWDLIVIARLH
jgi:dolichyl-phosphate beta-glucosyltransferase